MNHCDIERAWQITTPPASEPVSVATLKLQCRIASDDTSEDALLTAYIKAAREMVESDTERCLMTQTHKLYLERFPSEIVLDRVPVTSVSVQYYDADNSLQPLAGTEYGVLVFAEPAKIVRAYGRSWPSTYKRPDAVQVTLGLGYASDSAVPEKAQQAIRLLAAHWYENRETVGRVTGEISMAYSALVERLRWR